MLAILLSAQPAAGVQFSSFQRLSHVWLFVTPWAAASQASLSITNSWSLLKLMSIESVMPSNHLILCHPLLLLPSIFPSIRVLSSESVLLIRWSEYWSFSFSISPSNDYSRLKSFRIDWLDLLAVQGTLKSFLQHHSSKASILWGSAAGGFPPIALILSKTPKVVEVFIHHPVCRMSTARSPVITKAKLCQIPSIPEPPLSLLCCPSPPRLFHQNQDLLLHNFTYF